MYVHNKGERKVLEAKFTIPSKLLKINYFEAFILITFSGVSTSLSLQPLLILLEPEIASLENMFQSC